MKKSKIKWILILVVAAIVLFLGLGLVRGPRLRERIESRRAGEQPVGEVITVTSGDMTASVLASGQVKAERAARLALGTSGTVGEVHVRAGDSVVEGQPLVQLELEELERAVRSAEQAVAIQKASLAMLLAPPAAETLASAEAAVTSAQAQLDNLLAGPAAEEIEASEANVRATQANVWAASEQLALAQSGAGEAEVAAAQAELIAALGQQESTQELYDNLLKCVSFDLSGGETREVCPGLGAPEEQTRASLDASKANVASAQATLDALLAGPDADAISIAQAGVAAASAALEAAEANHALLLQGASEAQIAAARANLAQAEANLATVVEGPDDAQVAAAELGLVQAQVALERAQKALDEATLKAPFDGTITAVAVNTGEMAGGIAAEIAESGRLVVELDVDEVDIGSVVEGQMAEIVLEALPAARLSGRVQGIAPKANQNQGSVVSYRVTITLDENEVSALEGALLAGMTADATLTTAGYEDVLLVPNQAINADRASGRYTVNLVDQDGSGQQVVTEIEVKLGLRDGAYTQVTEGLEEGDQLLVGNSLPVQNLGNEIRRPFGG